MGTQSVLPAAGDRQMTALHWLLAALIYLLMLYAIVRVVRGGGE